VAFAGAGRPDARGGPSGKVPRLKCPSLSPERAKVAKFYSARSKTIPPLPRQTFALPFSDQTPSGYIDGSVAEFSRLGATVERQCALCSKLGDMRE